MSTQNMGSMPASVVVTREPDRSGNLVCDGTADDVQIQEALDRLSGTAWGKVYVFGDMDITAKITLPDYCWLEIIGSWTLANGVNDYMIENTSFDYIKISGPCDIDGNGANQTAGGVINLQGSGGANDVAWLEDMRIQDGYDSCIRSIVTGRLHMTGVDLTGRSGAQWAFVTTNGDHVISNCIFTGSATAACYIEGSTSNEFSSCYFGGGVNNVRIKSSAYGHSFASCVYGDSGQHGIYVEGDKNTFNGGWILPSTGTTDNTYSAIYVDDGEDNIFTGMIAEGRASHRWKYGYEEAGTADYNLVNGLTARTQIGTAATLVLGANSSAVNIIG